MTESETGAVERLAKRMARAGVCSRREAEKLIETGKVKVNGKTITTPAFNVSAKDVVSVNGKALDAAEKTRLWLYHKPAGLITTHKDPEGRPTLFDALPKTLPRVISVGRLDFNSEGLLLLTNDGALARHLELPATGWVRRYRVRAHGRVNAETLAALKKGTVVDGVRYGSIEAEIERAQGANVWLSVRLSEGKNREIRKVFEHHGCVVNRLIRVAYGPFQLGAMKSAEVREVPGKTLRELVGKFK